MNTIALSCGAALATTVGSLTSAGITTFTNYANWSSAAGPDTMLAFNDFAPGTIITDQYAANGVLFTDGDDSIASNSVFGEDSFGLIGDWGWFGFAKPITLQFDGLRSAVAVSYPATVSFTLYSGSTLLGSTAYFNENFTGPFAGITSTIPFDRVVIQNDSNTASMDSLRFGAAVPAPSVLISALALWLAPRRRRG